MQWVSTEIKEHSHHEHSKSRRKWNLRVWLALNFCLSFLSRHLLRTEQIAKYETDFLEIGLTV